MRSTAVLSPTLRTRMRIRALRYGVTFTAPVLALFAFLYPGWHTWALPVYAFALVPLLDALLPARHANLSEAEEQAVLQDPLYDWIVYALVPVQWGLLLLFLVTVSEPGLALWERAGRIATMGLLCGVYGINVAHELGHRVNRWERTMARALLLTSLYMHFIIEHNRGHHKRVATPDDPASARYGETLYAFWLRSIVFSLKSAWELEAGRLRKKGMPVWGPRNEMLQGLLLEALLVAAIGLVLGPWTMLAFVAAALLGILLLETVNYIEHYGLRRKPGAQGGWARVLPVHSWNSDHALGRLMLFELTRHSDHHHLASRKYQVLRSIEEAPQLPTGYPGTMLLALVPPLFFRVMHPRLESVRARQAELDLAA